MTKTEAQSGRAIGDRDDATQGALVTFEKFGTCCEGCEEGHDPYSHPPMSMAPATISVALDSDRWERDMLGIELRIHYLGQTHTLAMNRDAAADLISALTFAEQGERPR